jgi:hypothetical protein
MKSKMSINNNGDIKWKNYKGQFHREDGPAFEDKGGYKSWWINGKKHREDGPAIEWSNGDKEWFISGIQKSEVVYKKKMRSRKLNQLLQQK